MPSETTSTANGIVQSGTDDGSYSSTINCFHSGMTEFYKLTTNAAVEGSHGDGAEEGATVAVHGVGGRGLLAHTARS